MSENKGLAASKGGRRPLTSRKAHRYPLPLFPLKPRSAAGACGAGPGPGKAVAGGAPCNGGGDGSSSGHVGTEPGTGRRPHHGGGIGAPGRCVPRAGVGGGAYTRGRGSPGSPARRAHPSRPPARGGSRSPGPYPASRTSPGPRAPPSWGEGPGGRGRWRHVVRARPAPSRAAPALVPARSGGGGPGSSFCLPPKRGGFL